MKNIFQHFETEIARILADAGFTSGGFTCETPRDASHGDIATNAAMVLAKGAGMAPRELAEKIKSGLEQIEYVKKVEIAGPGFINLRLDPIVWQERIADILREGENWGKSAIGKGKKINVEFVSANPTGPLHAAHARGAIIGDSLSSLLESAGYDVIREYYINDAGAQVEALARSLQYRYGGGKSEKPEGYYPGDYLQETAEKMPSGAEDLTEFREFAVADMMESIKTDLLRLGIKMDRFSSERALVENGAVERVMEKLEADGLLYRGVLEPPKGKLPDDWEPREQLLFRATQFGDDTDRPVQKSDGSWTYFAADMAYHLDKLTRGDGVDVLIDIWGADHGGYVKRMQAAVAALSGRDGALDIKLCQLVKLMDGGKPVKMSKRAGTFVTLSDVLDSVGKDILRFIMLTRRSDQSMDFDYAKVTEQSKDNPVFYVQYAHARACSVLRKEKYDLKEANLGLLAADAEMALVKMLASWPRMVESAAVAHEPHRIAFALTDMAAAFHALWNTGRDDPELRFIMEGKPEITAARLALVDATRQVIANGLAMLGVEAATEM